MSGTALDPKTAPKFQTAAKALLRDSQLRKNVRHATNVIQAKRARVVGEMPDLLSRARAMRVMPWPTAAMLPRSIRSGTTEPAAVALATRSPAA